MRAYTPRVFRGDVLFFTATEGRPAGDFGLDLWAPYLHGRIENHDIPHAHAQLMQPEARQLIGLVLAARLRGTTAG